MELLVIRHGSAEDAGRGVVDSHRALTDAGRKEMKEVSAGLATIVETLDVIAASPLVRAQQTAQDGDMVVALLTNGPSEAGEATLKRFYREKGGLIRLQPANAAMQPIMVSERDVRIQGKVISVIREV